MELTALALFLASTPQALPDFTTIDGRTIPYAEGEAALHQGQAVLIGGLFVGSLSTTGTLPVAA
ncbi:hypothetical protein J0X19_06720 [Hymenobacter sp. BT186]|uniref:Uncharacterized protein n=1 Tax=Hymenobacter telluris TaxID=2816474 RepID=A0A939EUU0_9BACT|nr:hypothetical protein [Hymenobacter telluris]MBO0357632.1 hypothetical protein [Hymenobacter telluris]MBW3373659.1 hypothetical protein [Hymenobacter norwichensis]